MLKMAFMLESEVIKEHEKKIFDLSKEIEEAKKYLQQHSIASGCSIYDHLTEVIQKMLICKPEEIVETFEIFSKQVKDERFIPSFDTLQDVYTPLECLEDIKQMIEFYKPYQLDKKSDAGEDSNENTNENEVKRITVPNVMETNFYFRQAGFGLQDNEAFNVMVALEKLTNEPSIAKIRFFGKIFGTKNNYYIAETDLTSEAIAERIKEFEGNDKSNHHNENDAKKHITEETFSNREKLTHFQENKTDKNAEDAESVDSDEFPDFPPIPRPAWKAPELVPQEKPGDGCNKKVYWVCNKLGDVWVSLPDVTPEQISTSRHFIRYMTGDIDTPMNTYPPFDGTEREYIRAQISRMVASTSVSPLTYYTLGVEEEEDDQQNVADDQENADDEESGENDDIDNNATDIKKNKSYKALTIEQLTDKSLSFWVHHTQHILNQGRTSWWNPDATEEGEAGEDNDVSSEERSEPSLKAEWGPSILMSLSEDKPIGGAPAWTAVTCYNSVPSATLAFLYSRRWPGAVAYATKDGKYDNMYIGWGVKCNPEGFSPMPLPPMCQEYPLGPEIMEMNDPALREEENHQEAQMPSEPLHIKAESDEEVHGEEAEGDEELHREDAEYDDGEGDEESPEDD